MATINILVDCPDDLAPELTQSLADDAILAAVEQYRTETAERTEVERIFESDDALREWVGRNFFGKVIVLRATAYDAVDYKQEMYSCGCRIFSDDPRRPVFLRGSMALCIANHRWGASHSANGWCYLILKRYLRLTKFTCFHRRAWNRSLDRVVGRLCDKYHLSYHFHDRVRNLGVSELDGDIWLNGRKRYGMTEHQIKYLAHLNRLAQRLNKTFR